MVEVLWRARGVRVVMGCPPALTRLFSDIGADLVPWAGAVSVPRCDAWVLAGSLPRHLTAIPNEPYLLGREGGVGLGVVVRGNPSHPGDGQRSLPEPFASAVLAMGRDLSPEATGAQDFEDTAAIIRDLKGVVTVDTSVAHLAGAMGKPTYLLLARNPDWRWGVRGERTIWYPSMRLLRQEHQGDWGPVIQQLVSGSDQ